MHWNEVTTLVICSVLYFWLQILISNNFLALKATDVLIVLNGEAVAKCLLNTEDEVTTSGEWWM